MRVIGLLCGAGNLLFEAKALGAKVIGNLETRSPYHAADWVWKANFGKLPLIKREQDFSFGTGWFNADIALGHPPCGNFSTLGQSTAYLQDDEDAKREWNTTRNKKAGLLPDFIKYVNRFEPKIFALDNLVKMLEAYPKEWWEEQLPGYHITILDIWNWSFGSPQRRRRLWIVGSRRKRFRFVMPDKRLKGPRNTWEAISDLPWEPWKNIEELAHVHHAPSNRAMGSFRFKDIPRTNGSVAETAFGYLSLPPGKLWPYRNAQGRLAKKPAHVRLAVDCPARTPSKMETLRHPFTGWPLTPRERARIMGWPDDFIMHGPELDQLNLRRLSVITGKAVPNEFMRFLLPQLIDHV